MDMSGLRRARLSLRGPVGNGLDNHPDDVLAVKHRLNDLGLYDEPAYGFTGYIDRDTEEGVRKFQKERGLKIDGWLKPGGETERGLNRNAVANIVEGEHDWLDDRLGLPLPVLRGEVGNGRDNDETDILGVRRRLDRLGYPLARGDSPFIDRNLTDTITAFQRDNGLKADGWFAPGGETERALQQMVSVQRQENLSGGAGRDTLTAENDPGRIGESERGDSLTSRTARNLLEEAQGSEPSPNRKPIEVAQADGLPLPRPFLDFVTVGIPALLGMQALRDKDNPPGTPWQADPLTPAGHSQDHPTVTEPRDSSEGFGNWLERQFGVVFSKSEGG